MSKRINLRDCVRRLIRNWAVPVGCGLFFLFILRFVFIIGYVPTVSMEPTIKTGSFIMGFRIVGDLKRGDIVIFERNGMITIKRIVALPGDTVYIDENGNVFTNITVKDKSPVLLVPEGKYFVLGDNSECSIDSRYWSDHFISRSQIIASLCQPL